MNKPYFWEKTLKQIIIFLGSFSDIINSLIFHRVIPLLSPDIQDHTDREEVEI